MKSEADIPEPFLFNPLKHHLGYIRKYAVCRSEDAVPSNSIEGGSTSAGVKTLIRELKHLGTSVMDVYAGHLQVDAICSEIPGLLKERDLLRRDSFALWAGTEVTSFRIITLSDSSQWTVKYHNNDLRYIHFFPARYSPHSFRVKSNTLKSALLYNILIGKDFISGDDLNRIRPLLGLSPVREPSDAEAVTEMIELLRL